jgi:hypothetical protein
MIIDARINLIPCCCCPYSLHISFAVSSHMALLLRQMHAIYAYMSS